MNDTPKGLRLHIALFGRRNVGKSSLLNALSGQQASIVSDTPGTTTDPVEKTLEMAPLGPVVFLDTAGLDDEGELGAMRAERSLQILERVDVALLVTEGTIWGETENRIASLLHERKIPFAILQNKADIASGTDSACEKTADCCAVAPEAPCIRVSALNGQGLDEVRAVLQKIAPEQALLEPPLLSDLLPAQGVLVLVVPIDTGAPKGRLILPQVQAIRDSLDGQKICMAIKETELSAALDKLKLPPDLVVCDSQVVHTVERELPTAIPMTTFSILMARFKGDLSALVRGAAALRQLKPGDTVLIQEACSHHPQKDDIGRVKLPRLLQKLAGGPLHIRIDAGKEFPAYDPTCKVVVHCGGCVITRGQMLARLRAAEAAGCPMTNYGLAIASAQGVLARALSPFPEALRIYQEACESAKKLA